MTWLSAITVRRMHLFRPDLILRPFAGEVYC